MEQPYTRGSAANILAGWISFGIPGLGQFLQGRPMAAATRFFIPWLTLTLLALLAVANAVAVLAVLIISIQFTWHALAAREACLFEGQEELEEPLATEPSRQHRPIAECGTMPERDAPRDQALA